MKPTTPTAARLQQILGGVAKAPSRVERHTQSVRFISSEATALLRQQEADGEITGPDLPMHARGRWSRKHGFRYFRNSAARVDA